MQGVAGAALTAFKVPHVTHSSCACWSPCDLDVRCTAALQIPRVLAVAGSDPGGGAGIQADLKTFQARGVFGMAAVTALTSQNTHGVNGVHTPPVDFLRRQMESVLEDLGADVVKTGMLPSAAVRTGRNSVSVGGCFGAPGA